MTIADRVADLYKLGEQAFMQSVTINRVDVFSYTYYSRRGWLGFGEEKYLTYYVRFKDGSVLRYTISPRGGVSNYSILVIADPQTELVQTLQKFTGQNGDWYEANTRDLFTFASKLNINLRPELEVFE